MDKIVAHIGGLESETTVIGELKFHTGSFNPDDMRKLLQEHNVTHVVTDYEDPAGYGGLCDGEHTVQEFLEFAEICN